MSHPENTKWLENLKEHFDGACETAQWALAEAFIADCREFGYAKEAYQLHLQLTHSRFHNR